VLVCGDLNDTPQAATTQILLGPPGSQLDTGGFTRPDAGDGNRLWNLAPKMPPGDPATGAGAANWSRINNGVKELIDQILVSHQLVHALDSTESLPIDGIKSATANPASLADMEAPSDHRPVIARFSL
jgi:endonuclease/exonuclease/phosphatase (EEP) superfamily protein YafD